MGLVDKPAPGSSKAAWRDYYNSRRAVEGDDGAQLTAIAALHKRGQPMVYNLRVESPFILTPTHVKKSLGSGFKVLSIEAERDLPQVAIKNVDDAVRAILQTGYRALARANHPDLGGDPETMVVINRAKKELSELLDSLRA